MRALIKLVNNENETPEPNVTIDAEMTLKYPILGSSALRPTDKQLLANRLSTLEENAIVLGKYLCRGGNGVIFTGRHQQQDIAIKVCERAQQLENEMIVSANFSHPNVMSFIRLHTNDTKILAMELADADLLGHMKATAKSSQVFGLKCVRVLFAHIVGGVQHMHSRHFAHLDLKPQNVLITRNVSTGAIGVKICDFDFTQSSHELDGRLIECVVDYGTDYYSAPEIVSKRKSRDKRSADVWALGVMLYQMVTFHYPYHPLAFGSDDKRFLKAKEHFFAHQLSHIYERLPNNYGDQCVPQTVAIDETVRVLKRFLSANDATRESLDSLLGDPWFESRALQPHDCDERRSLVHTEHM
ncbi:MAG: protein kinase domain-containing protein, partial [Candidatus Dormibacteria bacterium]